MLGVARELVEADRTGSWQMHLHAISDCLPIFSAAGHPNYLKSAYLYLQNMVTLESDNPAVFQKFVNGFHVIRRSEGLVIAFACPSRPAGRCGFVCPFVCVIALLHLLIFGKCYAVHINASSL